MKSPKKYTLFYFAFTFVLSTVLGCDNSNKSDQKNDRFFPTQLNDTLKLDIGFPYRSKFFEHEGKSYVCLYDVVTYKKVKLYDEDLNWIKTFSLEQFVDLGYILYDLEMITPDSVLLMTDYTSNVLISLNTKTQKTKTIELNTLFPFPNIEASLEFYSSFFCGFKDNKELIFEPKASQTSLMVLYPNTGVVETIKKYDSINKVLPAFVSVIDPFGPKPKIKEIKHSDAFIESYKNAYYNELNYSFIGNGKILTVSRYQDYIDVYDLKTKKALKKQVKSNYTDISVAKRTWDELNKLPSIVWTEYFNRDLRNAGRVHRMFYDAKKKRYHVLLFYSEKSNPIKDPEVSPFIWQVYDENFVLLSEREHAPTDLVIGSAIATKKYIYFPYYNANTYDPSQAVLVRYTF